MKSWGRIILEKDCSYSLVKDYMSNLKGEGRMGMREIRKKLIQPFMSFVKDKIKDWKKMVCALILLVWHEFEELWKSQGWEWVQHLSSYCSQKKQPIHPIQCSINLRGSEQNDFHCQVINCKIKKSSMPHHSMSIFG